MKTQIDLDAFLHQRFFGLDSLTMLGDVEDFIKFSEINIDRNKQKELRRAERGNNRGQTTVLA